jgi:hypothetical protein
MSKGGFNPEKMKKKKKELLDDTLVTHRMNAMDPMKHQLQIDGIQSIHSSSSLPPSVKQGRNL